MGRSGLVLTFFVISGILLFESGCQELSEPAGEAAAKPEVAAAAPNKPAVTTEAKEPEKPAGSAVEARPKPVEIKPAVDVNTLEPVIRFDKVVHDFGEVGADSSHVCEFGFKNAGEGLLKITDIKAPCGCTVYTLEKREYLSVESGQLKVKYYVGSLPGEARKYVYVYSNDKVSPQITLTLKATIVARVDYEPKRLNLLLKDENEPVQKITLTGLDGRAFSIKSIMSTLNALEADFDSSVEATKFILQLRVDKSRLRRITSGVIEFNLTHPECKQVRIPFNALTRFKVNPALLYITAAQEGKPVTRDVWVLNNYEEDFEIESARSQSGNIKVLSQEKIGNGYKFSLEITPPDSGGSLRFSDEFLVQIKDAELLRVNCQGFYMRK